MSGPQAEYSSTLPTYSDKNEVVPQHDSKGRQLTRGYIPSTVINGQKTVSSAGTAEPLVGSSTEARQVIIKALSGNTNNVYVGDSSVDSSNGYVLASGKKVKFRVADLANVYLDVDTGGEGVSFIGVN